MLFFLLLELLEFSCCKKNCYELCHCVLWSEKKSCLIRISWKFFLERGILVWLEIAGIFCRKLLEIIYCSLLEIFATVIWKCNRDSWDDFSVLLLFGFVPLFIVAFGVQKFIFAVSISLIGFFFSVGIQGKT